MSLLNTMANYINDNDKGEKAAFDAAMIDRVSKEPLGVSDIFWELYQTQKRLVALEGVVAALVANNRPVNIPKAQSPKKPVKKDKNGR